MREPAPVRRLFFALWPDETLRAALVAGTREVARSAGGRLQSPEQLHLTLVFLGAVPEARLGDVLESAAAARGAPCEIRLDRLEYWSRPRVLCLTSAETPQPLLELVESLTGGLRARGFATERRPFRVHLTLSRDSRPPPREAVVAPLVWPATEFALVESVTERTGARYRPLERWSLGPRAGAAAD